MKIVRAYPPNIEAIKRKVKIRRTTIYTYGDTIYNPAGEEIPDYLMVHEETHEQQQAAIGIEKWWEIYLNDKQFRLDQELEAYRNQYKFINEHYSRHYRIGFLIEIASDLASDMYGRIVSKDQARDLILNET